MSLTPRQAQIATLVGKGFPTPAIARETGLSPETVNAHIKQAAQRLPGDTSPRHKLILWFLTIRPESAA